MEEIDFRAANILKKMGDPVRYSCMLLLRNGEKTPNELAALLGRNQDNISQHLAVLRAMDAVRFRTIGKKVYYRVKARDFLDLMAAARKCAFVSGKEMMRQDVRMRNHA